MALSNNAEGGTSGVAPTTGDTGSGDSWTTIIGPPAAGTLEYTNAWSNDGALGYRAATRGTVGAAGVGWTTTAAVTSYHRIYFQADVAASASYNIVAIRNNAVGSVGVGFLAITVTNNLRIINAGGTTAFTGSWPIAVSTPYRLEWTVTSGGATSTCRYLLSGLGERLLEDSGTITITPAASGTTHDEIRIGQLTAGAANLPNTTGFFYWDSVCGFAADWVGGSTSPSSIAHAMPKGV